MTQACINRAEDLAECLTVECIKLFYLVLGHAGLTKTNPHLCRFDALLEIRIAALRRRDGRAFAFLARLCVLSVTLAPFLSFALWPYMEDVVPKRDRAAADNEDNSDGEDNQASLGICHGWILGHYLVSCIASNANNFHCIADVPL
jgi:hypothetical protein